MESQDELRERYKLTPVPYDPTQGYPVGEDLYYECPRCHFLIRSRPRDYAEAQCSCRYLFIDIDWGRLAVGDQQRQPALFRLSPKSSSHS